MLRKSRSSEQLLWSVLGAYFNADDVIIAPGGRGARNFRGPVILMFTLMLLKHQGTGTRVGERIVARVH